MTVAEFLKETGMNPHQLAQAAGISYSTLHPHVKRGKKVGERTARKLERFSQGKMTAVEILGLTLPPPRDQEADGRAVS